MIVPSFVYEMSIIDPDGVVQAAEINADGIGRDASTLVHKIKAAQYVY
jgi:alkyl hydroperoxide reductase subunit AhpC